MTKIKLSIFLLAAVGLMTSCNDFLNKYPDNRMELHTPSDVSKLVASAYPDAYPAYLLEMYSDNTDEQVHNTWSSMDRFQEQAYGWEECKLHGSGNGKCCAGICSGATQQRGL